ncbi:MAG: NAD(P)-dependent oxidoreductase, partial [Nitriliruptorales bacterium]|nr:NAD(P)-dependent oxidoreductase [Nitriliruptorales bacterium]
MAAEPRRIGWIGAGRMGYELMLRLLAAGYDLAVWNRTRAKAEPLAEHGATIVDGPRDLADRDLVVTMVSSSSVFEDVTIGSSGLFSSGSGPRVLVDSSTVSAEASQRVAAEAAKFDTALLAAPVSGNPNVVKSGQLTTVVSGDGTAFDYALPVLETFGSKVTYVGSGDEARLVKMCHNVLLGVVTQSLAEITVLAERAGVSRADFLEFINSSVMGSVFTR